MQINAMQHVVALDDDQPRCHNTIIVRSHLNPGVYPGASASGQRKTPYILELFPRAFTSAIATALFSAGVSMTFATHMRMSGDIPLIDPKAKTVKISARILSVAVKRQDRVS